MENNPQAEFDSKVKSISTDAANEVVSKSVETINETLSTKATAEAVSEVKNLATKNAEDNTLLQKQIDTMKNENAAGFTAKQSKESNFLKEFKGKKDSLAETLEKGTKTILNLKDFGSGFSGTFNGDIYGDERVSQIKYDPNYQNRLKTYISTGMTSQTGSIRFNQETVHTDLSSGKGKGAAQAQQVYTVSDKHQPIQTLMNLITIPEEWLDDTSMIEQYLSNRLMGDLLDLEDRYILRGTGAGNQYEGINVGAASANTLTTEALANSFLSSSWENQLGTTANRFDVLTSVMSTLYSNNFTPSLAVLHPDDYYRMTNIKATTGEYVLHQTVAPDGTYKTFWNGIEVIKHNAQVAGTFTVLDGSVVQYWMREGVSIEFDRNDDDFASNSISVRAKLRGAMTNYRPNGIVTGSFASVITSLNA